MKHQGLSSLDAKHLYTKIARELPTYGVTFFVVKEKQQKGKKKLVPRLLGISASAILRLDEESKEILQAWPLTQVMSYQVGKSHTFTLNFGDYSDKEYSVKTNDAVRIRDILQGYIDIIAKRLAGARNATMNDGQAVMEDNVHADRAHYVQRVMNNPSKVVEESFVGPTKIISYEPGQTVSQGTQLVTVQQVIISNKMANQQYSLTGEVLHRKGMSLEFVRKLNRMNSNSVKVVNLISGEDGPHTAELTSIVNTMQNDLPLIVSGVNDIAKTDMDEEAKNRLLNELRELTDYLNTLSRHVHGPHPECDEALEAASKIADVSTKMYLGLDPLTKRRSNLIRISRQSFIEDDKLDATLRRASFVAAADGARAAADNARYVLNQAYEGAALTPSEVEALERAARDKMRKLNGAVALFLTAHADLENVDYSAAVTSMNTINELILELAKDGQALASTKDDSSKQELIEDISKLCESIQLVCALPGCADHQKMQDVTSAYGPVADKLIFTFGRGRRDVNNNRIIDLAKEVGTKTSILLMKANELTGLLPPPQAEELDSAGVQCAAAGSDLLACAMLTSPCIHEPHCQSALTASAESLGSAAQRLLGAARPVLEDGAMSSHAEELRARSMELAKALDALKNAYGNESNTVKDPRKLKFMMRLADAKKDLDEAEDDLNKPSASKRSPSPVVAAMLEKTLALRLAEHNAAVACLLVATTDRDNPDFAVAEAAIVKIHETMPGIVKDMKTLSASKDEESRQVMLGDARKLCAAARGLCAAGHGQLANLNESAAALADTSNKLFFTFNPTAPADKEQEILDIATAACTKASVMLSDVYQLAEQTVSRGELLDAAGATTAERAKALLTCAQLTAAYVGNPSCQAALVLAADCLSTSSSELAKSCSTEQSPLADRICQQQRDLEDELDKLRKACMGARGVARSPEEERQKLQFVKSAAAAKTGLLAIEQELNKPLSAKEKDKLVLTRQQQLSDAMARLNSAIASLITATADSDNPDYAAAEEAMAAITELMPLVVMDTKAMACSKDDKTQEAMLSDLRSLCDATRDICEAHHDPQQLRESAKKFGAASSKLVFVLNPRRRPDDANKVIKHANLVCKTGRQLVKDVQQLAASLYHTDLAASRLRTAGGRTLDAVDALLTATQLTAPSLGDHRCQSVLLSSLDALSQSSQQLAQQWAPIQAVDKQQLVRKLDAQHAELVSRLEDMRRECLGDSTACPEKTTESKSETKEKKRVRFADTVSATKADLMSIEEELSKPYNGTLPKDQALSFKQLQLSSALARLNAALAALAVATVDLDNPDYVAANEAMNIIHETLPQVAKDTKAMAAVRDDVAREMMMGNVRALCFATAQICDQANKDPKALRQFAKNFATASGKLIYGVNSRAKQNTANQVMQSTQAACKTANQLVKTSSRLTDHLSPTDDVRHRIAESGGRTADAADALMTAAQLTSPCISDHHCKVSFSTSIDSLSSSARELSSHWSPLLQEPLLTAVLRELEKESRQLTAELGQLRNFCQDSKEDEKIVHKSITKPAPPARKPSDEEIKQKQFTTALEKVAAGVRAAEEDIKSVYACSLDAPSTRSDRTRGIRKALEKKIALSNVTASALLACCATEPMDYAAATKSTSDLASLMPKIAQEAKVLSNGMPQKQRQAFLDNILAMFDAARKVIDAAQNDRNNLNAAAVEYGNKSGPLLYSVCTDFDPSQEKEVISRAKAIGECVSSLTESSSNLMSSEVGDLVCARGKACVAAAANLVYTAKLVAPSIQVQECREILLDTSEALSNKIKSFSSTWQPLYEDPQHKAIIEELDVKTAKAEDLLRSFAEELESGKLVRMRPLEQLEAELTPLGELTAAVIDSALKKSTNTSLPPEQRSAYLEYARVLRTACDRVDRANAVCKKEPHNLVKMRELEEAVQNLQVLALQSRPSLGNQQQQYIVDLTEYVKELSQEADKMLSTTASCSTKHKEIDKSCREITEEAERIMNPSNHHVRGDATTVDDIHEVDRFGRVTGERVKEITSEIQGLPDSKDKILLNTQSVNLEDSCNILRFASQSAISTSQSASLDDTLSSLSDLETRIEDLLASGDRRARHLNEPIPWSVRSSLLQATRSLSSQPHLCSSVIQYVEEQRTRTDLTNPDAKNRLQEHLKKLTYLLRVLAVETSRRVATWQELKGPEVAAVMEQVIKEIAYGCNLNQPKNQKSVLQNIDLNRLLLSSDVIKIEGDRKDVEDKLQQTSTKLSSMLSSIISRSSEADCPHVCDTACELAAVARALRTTDPVYNTKIEDAVNDVTLHTYNVLNASDLVSQESNNPAHRRRLLDACRLLNDALNNLSRTTSSSERKVQRECSELTRNLQFNETLLQTVQPTCALPYSECLDALLTQQEVIQKLNSEQLMSREEFSRTLSYVSSAVCNSTELTTHCGYLMSLGERDKEAAMIGVVDVQLLRKLTESAQATCYRILQFDTEQAKEEAVHLISQTRSISEALVDAEKKSLHLKEELRSAARILRDRVDELERTLAHPDKAKISAASMNVLDSIQTAAALTEHPALVPSSGELSDDRGQQLQQVLHAARDLTTKTVSLIRDVKNHEDRHGDDDEPMTWVTFNLRRKDVVKAFENLLASVRESGQKAGILEVEHKEEEPPKSYVEMQVELANKWLKRPNCKPEVKASGEEAVRKVIEIAQKMGVEMKESEKEDVCVLITETKDLLSECSKKSTPEKASLLVERLKSLKKAIERGVITMVVEEFIEGDEPLQDLEVLADSETDGIKRKFILERKIAELLAQLGRVTRTARAVAHAGPASPQTKLELNTCTEQANLLAPLLVKAAQERIDSPHNKAAIDNYKSLLAQYAESLSKVRELCDRSVDPMEFVQTAGETMQRMREESSHGNDPQKCVYTSSAITKLANRVIQVSMSSSNAKQDPELQKALLEAQQRLLAAVPGPQTRRSEVPDWKDTTAEILRTTGEVEAVMGGELIFQNQPQSDQPIFVAARDLHSVVREWSARDNEIVAVAKRTAVLMAKLSAHMNNNAQHPVLVTSRALAESSREVAELARRLALECHDVRIKTNLLQVCDQIPTISGQLKMLTTVKGSSLNSGNKEDQESLNMLVDNAQNLMLSIQQVVKVSAGASVKIAAQRGAMRVRWVRRAYY